MKVGIIGSGQMGSALGRVWVKSGHDIMFSYSRIPGKLTDIVHELGASAHAGTPLDAAQFADVLLLAVQWPNVREALSAAGPLHGKTLITCVNRFPSRGNDFDEPGSAAEEIARLATGAAVVVAFNSTLSNIVESRAHLFNSDTPTVFYCGDDHAAKVRAAGLIHDAGLQPVDAGPLKNARYLESLGALMTELSLPYRKGSDIALRLLSPAGPTEMVKSTDALARSFVGVFSGSTDGSAEGVLSEDFVINIPYTGHVIRGREPFENWMTQFRSAFTDFDCEVDDFINDGMRVAIRWTWSGTHTGEFFGISPTKRKIQFSEIHLLRVSGDRIVEDLVSVNVMDLFEKLGATSSPAGRLKNRKDRDNETATVTRS